jgi:hypothetical protein
MNRTLAGVGLALFGILGLAATGASAAAKDPFVGTWVLNAAKSDFGGGPALATAKTTNTMVKGGMKSVSDATYADGRTVHAESTGAADGKDVAVSGMPTWDSVTMLRADRHTIVRTERKGGKVVGITTITVAADGKSLTAKRRAMNAAGAAYVSTTFWERAKH